MFHKEGYKIIIVTIIIMAVLNIAAVYCMEDSWITKLIWAASGIFLILILQFFRNPKRHFQPSDACVLSPVDGKVVVIEKVFEDEYFKDERLQVSVFMSPINVHVTRYPIAGKVSFSKYHPGKYLVAWHPKASTENERTTVVVKHKSHGEVLYRQIAGALAKRIVNYAVEGDTVKQSSDSGFIKFGSRVDLYLPIDTQLDVTLNQKVTGGITKIASFTS